MPQKKIQITFPDSSTQEWPAGVKPIEIAQKIGARLAKDALAAKVNGKLVDLNFPIEENAKFEILTFDSEEGKHVYWHSSSHIMAAAIKNLFPNVKLGIGPPIEQGFYYDFSGKVFSDHELAKIEDEIKKIIKSAELFEKKKIKKEEAKKLFAGEPFKLQLIEEIPDKKVSIYKTGKFTDLCEGPHIPSADKIGAVKLLKTSAAYWKGDQKNQQLQRIYGISFRTQKELDAFVKMREEAEARDHRNIGKHLDLFVFSDIVGPGLPLFTPNGMIVRKSLADFVTGVQSKYGYKEVLTPSITKKDLYEKSGHWSKFSEDLFIISNVKGGDVYVLKPMNCPHHHMIYASNSRSYKDLPIRYADFSMLYRNEDPGQIGHNMTRVRAFSQDDSHIYCTFEQISQEFDISLKIIKEILEALGMKDYRVRLSTWDPEHKENYLGGEESWEKSQKMLISILEKNNIKYFEGVGEAAFYGPKADFLFKDSLGREWQLSTVQIDFNVPERFDLNYIGEDDKKHRPVVLHFAKLGSLERFMAIFIEHCAGAFPLWLSPVQVRIITVSDKQIEFAKIISEKLLEAGLRAETDFSNSTVEYKIRDSQLQKIPYTITIGDKEIEKKTLAVRGRDGKVRFGVSIEDFIAQMKKEIQEKK